jgi:outer membrane protein assembly factor BamB
MSDRSDARRSRTDGELKAAARARGRQLRRLRHWRRVGGAVVGIGALAAAIAVPVAVYGHHPGSVSVRTVNPASPPTTTLPDGGGAVATFRPRSVRSHHFPGNVSDLAVGDGSAWVGVASSGQGGTVDRLDHDDRVVAGITMPEDPVQLAYGQGGLWVLSVLDNGSPYQLTRIDPATNRIDRRTTISSHVVGNTNPHALLAVGDGAVWVTSYQDPGGARLVRVDPTTGATVASIPLRLTRSPATDLGAVALAVDDHGVWIGTDDGGLLRVDPATDTVTADLLPGERVYQVVTATNTLRALALAKTPPVKLVFIDPATGARTLIVPTQVGTIAAADGQLWAVDYGTQTCDPGLLSQLDPRTGTILRVTHLRPSGNYCGTTELAVANNTVWALDATTGDLARISP